MSDWKTCPKSYDHKSATITMSKKVLTREATGRLLPVVALTEEAAKIKKTWTDPFSAPVVELIGRRLKGKSNKRQLVSYSIFYV